MFTLCSSTQAMQDALPLLLEAQYLLVDFEGRLLGCENGALSLISIGTRTSASDSGVQVFLFDVLSLSKEALQPLLEILTNETTTKYFWDCRKDDLELRRTFGTSFSRAATIDLQLVDILSRESSGETEIMRLQRMTRRGHAVHALRQLPTQDVHALISLKNAPSEHRIGPVRPEKHDPDGASHDAWMMRPLPQANLDYAEEDIRLLAQMYAHFDAKGYLEPRDELVQKTARFLCLHPVPIPIGDVYRSSDLLPLEVLSERREDDAVYPCKGCSRMLSRGSFVHDRGGRDGRVRRKPWCKVCNILRIRQALLETGGPTIANIAEKGDVTVSQE
ncbi:hypothetical protein EXIGLDRAFT_110319 [Exidia glandulosa HHB12029]|uniref:3'-5' exonuclease domain-containing protein n=1 Tax=Exidia glandulosa HHB12029 TaxID=1314781 RepID=A0A166AD99_EXIGL|nr:hypothetical protein EXIGLDRAFT_110319 [Exidia glandulosa HHB12029]